MKFTLATLSALMMAESTMGFVPLGPVTRTQSRTYMAMDMPPAPDTAEIVQTTEESSSSLPSVSTNSMGQPSAVRYSEFLKMVNTDKVEKVTFSADGSQLLGVDVDGSRLKIETLPNDPDLLTQLTKHKVCYNDCC